MHCPRCGQQQVSEEIKYCSRCGFPLGLVSEILAQGGTLSQLDGLSKNNQWLTRNFGLKIALLWFLILTFLLVPLAGITYAPGEIIGGLAIIGFGGGLLLTVLSFMFLQNPVKPLSNQPALSEDLSRARNLNGVRAGTALPPQTSRPVSSYDPPLAGSWKAPETDDLIPHSVTDGTTRLLQKEEE
jgi:hypothetical protein